MSEKDSVIRGLKAAKDVARASGDLGSADKIELLIELEERNNNRVPRLLYEALRWFIDDIDGTSTEMVKFDRNVELARSALAAYEAPR